MRKLVGLPLVGAAAVLALVPHPAIAQDDPAVAPATSLSDAGRTVSGAGRSLSATEVDGLDPDGQIVTVSGHGFDADKGIYVTFCVLPPTNHPPTPCGGGQDRSGSSDASGWVSSNPPPYAAGLTIPYGPGGSFVVQLAVQPAITDTVDCRSVRCAIVTRNDHTRSTDRSQDLFLPVTFRSPSDPQPSGPTTTLPRVSTTTTSPLADPAATPPSTLVAPDGTSVSDGVRTLRASAVRGLEPGALVRAHGSGFDPAQGVYVALCRVPEVGQAPAPCTTGSTAAAWVSSNPPDYGRDLATGYGRGGTFEVELALEPVIDGTNDCRAVACAVATRSDDTAPADRRNDLLVPVAFAAGDDEAVEEVGGSLTASTDDSDGGAPVPALAGGGAAVLAVAGALAVRTRRRRGSTGAS
jgi:hypothetical protein